MAPTDRLDIALKILRIARGMSQKDLEQASGVRNNAISKYESGKAVPKLETLLRLTTGLGLPLSTVEEARAFIARLNHLADPGATGTSPVERSDRRDLRREIDQLSADAGRVATRLSALVLDLLARLPENDQR